MNFTEEEIEMVIDGLSETETPTLELISKWQRDSVKLAGVRTWAEMMVGVFSRPGTAHQGMKDIFSKLIEQIDR